MPDLRRATVTDEHQAEARALKALWSRVDHGYTQESFGQHFDIGSQAAVGFFLNGKSALSLKAAKGFAKGLGCSVADFSPRLAKEAAQIGSLVGAPNDGFIEVKRVDVSLSAGPGTPENIYEEVGSLSFRLEFLRACGVTADSARVVNVDGTSMEPTIPDGAVLLVNVANQEPRNGKIFALVKGNEGLVVKRLVKSGEAWFARSDNADGNPDFQINDGIPVTIIGRAVWMGAKL